MARHAMKCFYVYILQSEKNANRYYTGFTENIEVRLKAHNAGQNPHTAKHKPWRIKTSIAFTDKKRAFTTLSSVTVFSGPENNFILILPK